MCLSHRVYILCSELFKYCPALLTKCKIILAVSPMKPIEFDIKWDKAPWRTCHQRTLPHVGLTKQNNRVQVGESHTLKEVCCVLSPEVTRKITYNNKVAETYSTWTHRNQDLSGDPAKPNWSQRKAFQVCEFYFSSRLSYEDREWQQIGGSPSSPFYVTLKKWGYSQSSDELKCLLCGFPFSTYNVMQCLTGCLTC